MPTTKPATVTADRLKSFLERIEKLLEERAAIQSDIKDVFSEAKGVGYDVKTMRRLIQIRAQDSADRAEQEALLDTYMVALGMSNGATTAREPTEDELEERASRIVGEVDRCMELVVDGQLPKIAAIQEAIGCSLGKASKLRGMVEDRISRSRPDMREMKSSGGVEGHADNRLDGNDALAPVAAQAGAKRIGEQPEAAHSQPTHRAGVEPGPLDTSLTNRLHSIIVGNVELVLPPPKPDPDLGIPTSAPAADTRTFDEIAGEIPEPLRRRA